MQIMLLPVYDERYTSAEVSTTSTTTGSLWTVGIEDEFTLTVNGKKIVLLLLLEVIQGMLLI
jgi:hypothetical protein